MGPSISRVDSAKTGPRRLPSAKIPVTIGSRNRGDTIMNIIWLGHGSFRIEIAGRVLLIDPWLTGNPMLPEDQHDAATTGATHILLTHCHFDHVVDLLPLCRKLGVPAVGQYDIMNYWAEHE